VAADKRCRREHRRHAARANAAATPHADIYTAATPNAEILAERRYRNAPAGNRNCGTFL